MANTITLRKGAFSALPSSGLSIGEPLYSTEGMLHVASATNATKWIGAEILDQDDMSSNSATNLATQQSIKAYADTKITELNYLIDEDNMSTNSATRPPSQQSVKAYVDATAQGLYIHDAVKAATTDAFTITAAGAAQTVTLQDGIDDGGFDFDASADTLSLDGVSLAQNDRILIKDNITDSGGSRTNKDGGIFTVGVLTGSTAILTRATDFDTAADMKSGSFVFVQQGSTNADSGWTMTQDAAITINSTAITWSQFSGAGQITAGNGLEKSGNTLALDLKANGGLVIESAELAVDLAGSSITNTLTVGNGGTGATTLTDGGILLGNGTGAVQAMSVLAAGSIIQGDGTTDPAVLTKGSAGDVLTMNSGATAIEWAAPTTGDMSDLTDDTSPQLGGALDVQTHAITSTSNRNIAITPHGTGVVALATGDISLGAAGVGGVIDLVDGTAGSAGNAFTLKGSDVTVGSGTSSQIGGALTFEAGKATGNAISGNIIFKTYAAGSTDNNAVSDASATSITISGAGSFDGATISGGAF